MSLIRFTYLNKRKVALVAALHFATSVLGMTTSADAAAASLAPNAPQAFNPSAPSGAAPSWVYSIFGANIGSANLLVVPGASGTPRQIIFNSVVGNEHFWQIARHNPATGNYDQIFVSPMYLSPIKGISVGNVTGDSQPEIVVMLENGRIYFHDLATKVELGYLAVSAGDKLKALSLTDLNGDGVAELILTTDYNLLVFDKTGTLLWSVAGAGGDDLVVGQMDTDPALEIATTRGVTVVDCATRAIQWALQSGSSGSNMHLKLAPLPGASYQQLIFAYPWYDIFSYDVATQQERWSIRTPLDIGAIQVADVDNDGLPELLVGDAQGAAIRVHDLVTQAKKWEIDTQDSYIRNIAVDDVDNDGVVDLVWGVGGFSEFLYVANTTGTHDIKWRSPDLLGPFVGPAIGDLDGDGKSELVFACRYSEGGWAGPRFLVFDVETLALRAISPRALLLPVADDLKVRDLEGDGRAEIIIANGFGGEVDVFSFDSTNTFALKWKSPAQPPSGFPYTVLEIADLDNNGTQEIIAGNAVTNSSPGASLSIFAYPSTSAPWRSDGMGTGPNSVTGLVVADLDGNGSKEIAALLSTGALYTFDGPTRMLKSVKQQTGAITIADRRSPPGLILGEANGVGHFWKFELNNYTEDYLRELGSGTLTGLNTFEDGSLWIGTGDRLKLRLPPDYRGFWWQSGVFRTGLGRWTAIDLSNGRHRVFSSTTHAVAAYDFVATAPSPPTVLANISTRLRVGTGDDVLIGGFIVGGAEAKKVIVRAVGPSLGALGVPEPLANPTLELHGPNGLIASNDDWMNSPDKQVIIDSGLAPGNDFESAVVATLPANNTGYTAIVRGLNNTSGNGVVEVYDLNRGVDARMANISTRGRVQTGDNVLIAGTIVAGANSRRVIVRALGPSLPLADQLLDPMLELRDGNGALIGANDNWQTNSNKQAIIDASLAPISSREAAILTTLPGNNASYTAIVRGAFGLTGVALVEVYALE
jgi:hypothetical protein